MDWYLLFGILGNLALVAVLAAAIGVAIHYALKGFSRGAAGNAIMKALSRRPS